MMPMTCPFTLDDLINHTYEEIEAEGQRRGLYHHMTPDVQILRNLFNYSRLGCSFRSELLVNSSLFLN
jgi:hypothetical protein